MRTHSVFDTTSWLSIILGFVFFLLFSGILPISGIRSAAESASNAAERPVPVNENLVVFLSDPHLGFYPEADALFDLAITQIVSLNPRPVLVLVAGDLAGTDGKTAEYADIKLKFKPLDEAGIPWELTIGNHDNRENLFQALPEKKSPEEYVPGRHIKIVATPKADFILLDSRRNAPEIASWMAEKDKFPQRRPWDGYEDPNQTRWLDQKLAEYDASQTPKPVYVVAHHPLSEFPISPVLAKHPSVGMYIFGHVHCFEQFNYQSVDCLMLPTSSHRVNGSPSGWTTFDMSTEKPTIKVHELILPKKPYDKIFPKNAVILFQGDSITDGNRGRSLDPNHIHGHGYVYLIASDLGANYPERNWTFYNRGVSGNTLVELLSRWETDTVAIKPTVLSLMIGVNDFGRNTSPEDFAQRYDQLLKLTKEKLPDCQLILIEPFLRADAERLKQFEPFQKTVAEMAKKYHAIFVPTQIVYNRAFESNGKPDYWVWDSVHPTTAGQWLLYQRWLNVVSQATKINEILYRGR